MSRVDLADGLRQSGKGSALGVRSGWARKAFVVTEIALAVALVMGAGLLGRSLIALASVDMGFEGDRLVVLRTTVPVSGRPQFARAIEIYRNTLTELRNMPGVIAAGGVTSLPTLVRSNGGYWVEGAPGPEVLGVRSPQALFNVVTPEYFRALQVPVVRGRDFNDGDRIDAPFVAIINEQLAKDSFAGVDPIGRTIRAGLDSLDADDDRRHRQGRAHEGAKPAGPGGVVLPVRTASRPGHVAEPGDAHGRGRSTGDWRDGRAADSRPLSRGAGARRDAWR